MRLLRAAERAWTGSALAGLALSVVLLVLAVRDDARRARLAPDAGALRIVTRASIVLDAQLAAYFGLAVLAGAARARGERAALLIVGHAVLLSAAVHRLRVRAQMIAWSRSRRTEE